MLQTTLVSLNNHVLFSLETGYQYADILCCIEGCGLKFPNADALYEHTRTSHANFGCEICGSSVSRKSFKRHLMSHEDKETKPRLFCPYNGCTRSYANVSLR